MNHKQLSKECDKVQKFAAGGIGKIRLGESDKNGNPKGMKKCSAKKY